MGEESQRDVATEEWANFVAQMNEQLVDTMEASARAQAKFVESWLDSVEPMDEELFTEGMEGYARAYEVWMDAAEETAEEAAAVDDGEFSPDEFRDLWLDAANEAFKEVMSTDAFASFTGQAVEDALELRQAADESTQETLHELGFATERDVREVGERLVEFERRQKKVERRLERVDEIDQKLDRVLDRLEEDG